MKYHSLTNVTIVPNIANKSDRSPLLRDVFSKNYFFIYKNNYLKNLFLSIKMITPCRCNHFNFSQGGTASPLGTPLSKNLLRRFFLGILNKGERGANVPVRKRRRKVDIHIRSAAKRPIAATPANTGKISN